MTQKNVFIFGEKMFSILEILSWKYIVCLLEFRQYRNVDLEDVNDYSSEYLTFAADSLTVEVL